MDRHAGGLRDHGINISCMQVGSLRSCVCTTTLRTLSCSLACEDSLMLWQLASNRTSSHKHGGASLWMFLAWQQHALNCPSVECGLSSRMKSKGLCCSGAVSATISKGRSMLQASSASHYQSTIWTKALCFAWPGFLPEQDRVQVLTCSPIPHKSKQC